MYYAILHYIKHYIIIYHTILYTIILYYTISVILYYEKIKRSPEYSVVFKIMYSVNFTVYVYSYK